MEIKVNFCTVSEIERESVLDSICSVYGVKNPFSILTDFSYFKYVLFELGYNYEYSEDVNESHVFSNGIFELLVHPVCYYRNQGVMRVCNINIMEC